MRYYLAVAAALTLQLSAARAETIVALTGDDLLSTIDSRSGKVVDVTKIKGIGPVVLGLDVRPSDGQLYALASDGTVAVIDPKTGQATPRSKLDTLPPADVEISVDFNPVADRLRIIGSDGTNLRANVDDGKVTKDQALKFADTDPASGQTPRIIAAAYTNSMKGAKETALYDIDTSLGGLFRQAPPNDGILNSIGMLGIDAENAAFDITTDISGANMGMLLAKGNLYSVDLASGKAVSGKAIAGLPSGVRDIAVIPAMPPKQAANMTKSDGNDVKASAEMTAGYLPPKNMTGGNPPKSVPQTNAGYDVKGGTEKKSVHRADYDMQGDGYAPVKPKRNKAQCSHSDHY